MRLVLFLCLTAAAAAQTLPDGPGKAVVERMCTPCHGLENVVTARMSKDRWGNIVDDMVSRGATGTDEDIDQVINYLAANFGKSDAKKVNINKASAAELTEALDISAADAAAIVSYRTDKGSFKELKDVTKVPGIDTKKIEAAKDRLEF
ncbi:MAG: helix-hairpin-helix domain-containing protein [Bryobacteraceae bacterium]|jgi:competence protein ComEA